MTNLTPFTLVMAYYDNPRMLEEHVKQWYTKTIEDLTRNLHVRIVDDGSPRWPAEKVARSIDFSFLGSFELYRMKHDVPWNQDACRNIGAKHANTKWLMLTDMDHVVPGKTWARLMAGPLSKGTVYRFGRVTAPDLTPYKYHPNTWALTRALYWEIGGYDERLAGNYGTDGDFLVRARARAPVVDLSDVVIRYPRELIPDASTTTLERKRPDQKEAIGRLIKARQNVKDWKPLNFSFPYERVL